MKQIIFFLYLALCFSCENNDEQPSTTCTEKPLENIQWLKELVDKELEQGTSSSGLEIIQYNYKKQTVFSINSCINCADNLITTYNCDKNKVCESGGIAGLNTCPNFDTEATNKALLFTTRTSVNGSKCEKVTIISPELYSTINVSSITSAEIEEDCLKITFNILSTQDKIKDVMLVDSGAILESNPIQRKLKFNIKENLTKPTSISETTSFDISNLAEPDETIILNIDGYDKQITYNRGSQ